MKHLLNTTDFKIIAKEFNITYAQLKAIDTVESGGKGFDDATLWFD